MLPRCPVELLASAVLDITVAARLAMLGGLRASSASTDRVWIHRTGRAGKTTLRLPIGKRLGIPATDLDDLFWLPRWPSRPPEKFRMRVLDSAAELCWVTMGNDRAAFYVVRPGRKRRSGWTIRSPHLLRVLRRTVRRGLTGKPGCNGNREPMLNCFFTRKSLLWRCLTTYTRRRRECDAFMAETPPQGQIRLRHRSPREMAAWLRAVNSPS